MINYKVIIELSLYSLKMFQDKIKVSSTYQVREKAELSTSEVAKAKRCIRERKETYEIMNDELNNQMREAALNENFNEFKNIAANAKKLEELESKIQEEEDLLNHIMSKGSKKRQGKVSDEIKKEIHNLYHAGVSNQTQLADEYNVSQATVNKIVNDEPSKYRRK